MCMLYLTKDFVTNNDEKTTIIGGENMRGG